ncbi:hypothetical protein F511_31183 [Dorcoceras hygrometricum]|uniref:Uncharacterized protein n=1 Tax=Dorcoceras hygrometricum TaxID=472368 RepID=A0A2Z7CAV3_9LAMI|nr:hypothetical protein F511_31183 [Dorcoceras hygrometricum]
MIERFYVLVQIDDRIDGGWSYEDLETRPKCLKACELPICCSSCPHVSFMASKRSAFHLPVPDDRRGARLSSSLSRCGGGSSAGQNSVTSMASAMGNVEERVQDATQEDQSSGYRRNQQHGKCISGPNQQAKEIKKLWGETARLSKGKSSGPPPLPVREHCEFAKAEEYDRMGDTEEHLSQLEKDALLHKLASSKKPSPEIVARLRAR